jgi:hypothetical protein
VNAMSGIRISETSKYDTRLHSEYDVPDKRLGSLFNTNPSLTVLHLTGLLLWILPLVIRRIVGVILTGISLVISGP